MWRLHCRRMSTAARAVVLPRFGGPEVLELRPSVGVPDLKPREVLVRARAVSINPLDLRVSSSCLFPLNLLLRFHSQGDRYCAYIDCEILNRSLFQF